MRRRVLPDPAGARTMNECETSIARSRSAISTTACDDEMLVINSYVLAGTAACPGDIHVTIGIVVIRYFRAV